MSAGRLGPQADTAPSADKTCNTFSRNGNALPSAGSTTQEPSEPPTNTLQAVNKFADAHEALASLCALAPLHQRYAIRRGMRALGIDSDPPTFADLALAVERPEPPSTQIRRFLEGDRLAAWAIDQFLGRPEYLDETGGFDLGRAVQVASRIIGPAARERDIADRRAAWDAYKHATGTFDRWHPLAAWLAAYAAEMSAWVPDSRLTAMPEPELADMARTIASKHQSDIRAARMVATGADGTPYLAATGEILDPPLPALTPTERRLMCPLHWRRQLRRRAKRARQFWSAALQTTGGGSGTRYSDDYSHSRWQERQEAAELFGASHVLAAQDGTMLPLLDVMRSSVAATLNRVYIMTVGIEQIAEARGLVPLFVTITLPPEYHPNPRIGTCSWTPEFGPEEADDRIGGLWGLFRSRLAKVGIGTLGMRVFEGHEDGCPHLHGLLYVPPGMVQQVDDILQDIRPEPVPGQRIATKLVRIDTRRARASTYVMKYILKGLNQRPAAAMRDERLDPDARRAIANGILIPADETDDGEVDHQIEDFDRHRALASERGWRRFALLGVHGIQRIWQRLFVLDDAPDDAPENIRKAHAAMKERRWGDAILALGALRGEEGGRVRLEYTEKTNAYGEMRRVPARILDERTGWTLPIRSQDWTIERVKVSELDESEQVTIAVSCPSGGAEAPPKSSQPTDLMVAERLDEPIRLRLGFPQWSAAAVAGRHMMAGTQGPPSNSPKSHQTSDLPRAA